MESKNFEFLRAHQPELADLGGFAECYAHTDPAGALVKLRKFGEALVEGFLEHYQIPRLPKSNFLEMLRLLEQQNLLPSVILNKLHALRMEGNKAAHSIGDAVKPQISCWILREAFDLSKWVALSVYGASGVKSLEFVEPKAEKPIEKKALLKKLALQEASMQKLLAELEDARATSVRKERSEDEKSQIKQNASKTASVLDFDEAKTRKLLVDRMLVQAGWDVASENDDTDEVKKEFELVLRNGNKGVADYVLWGSDGKPLAVVEAKRTAHDPEKGRAQAKNYADALEKAYNQRPVIFYTNGYDLYIWDDAKMAVSRKVYGFYNKESLQRCLWETTNRKDLLSIGPNDKIIDRRYQIEAVKRVCERFQQQRRKGLIVQATGTGKTRVAIALTDVLLRAHWAKRILFLCDRRELRRQAHNAFAEHISSEPRIYVTSETSSDRNKTVYLATYPAMMKCFANFDVGFFDLVVADESHRSIYNRYRDIFQYFDALQVGLTATPRNIVSHDTYRMFDCENQDPTAHFSYTEAIEHEPPYLAQFEVTSHTTKFLREGIRYKEMTDEQKQQLEEDLDNPEVVDFAKEKISKEVFNRDTDRRILRNLMENGIRDASGQHIGKTILFARDHNHAVQLRKTFDELFPQYNRPGKEFCAVIDNYVDHAEQLIDDFKGNGNNDNLKLAISVDMLDTGIDVPEIVNLVFAKPLKSYVKFWQMIGRGTRICENLFGPGQHKETFRIFDHWGNFEYFDEKPPEVKPSVTKSLLQQLFEARIELAELALQAQQKDTFNLAVGLLKGDINDLPEETIAVREKWRKIHELKREGVIQAFDAATVEQLRSVIAPLMQWREFKAYEENYRTDLLITQMQIESIKKSNRFSDFSNDLRERVSQLPVNLQQVADKIDLIKSVKKADFWSMMNQTITEGEGVMEEAGVYDTSKIPGGTVVEKLENIRNELRGIMHCRKRVTPPKRSALYIDVTDSDEESARVDLKMEGLDLAAYRKRVREALDRVLEKSPVLQRIKAGKPVDDRDIQPLINKINSMDPTLRVDDLLIHFPNSKHRLDLAIRQIIGLDADAVDRYFTEFMQKYPTLTSHQMRFLAMIQKYIATYGKLEIDKLYEEPFTRIHMYGVDGVFTQEKQAEELLELINRANETALLA